MKHDEICELFQYYVTIIKETKRLDGKMVADQLGGFVDTLTDLKHDEDDGLTREEWLKEIGLCPDDGDHWAVECHEHGCRNYIDEVQAEHPWVPVAELGRYV